MCRRGDSYFPCYGYGERDGSVEVIEVLVPIQPWMKYRHGDTWSWSACIWCHPTFVSIWSPAWFDLHWRLSWLRLSVTVVHQLYATSIWHIATLSRWASCKKNLNTTDRCNSRRHRARTRSSSTIVMLRIRDHHCQRASYYCMRLTVMLHSHCAGWQ